MTGPQGDAPEQAVEQATPGFGERGRMRRRVRFLRKARELAYRDLGGLVFDLHRFGQRNDQVVSAKLATLGQIDSELRALEKALDERQPVTVLREVGIAACPRCAAIHGRDDRFCPGCGLAFDANAERPLATSPVSAHASPVDGAHTPPQAGTHTPPQAGTHTPPQAGTHTPPAGGHGPPQAGGHASPADGHGSPQAGGHGSPDSPQPSSAPAQATPPAKETAVPVAARPAGARDQDEPTQILRPPAREA